MAANTLSILTPSVNNLSVRIFVRAAGLEFEEGDMWGKKGTPEFLAKDPADRYQSAEEMRTDIQRALSGMPVAAPTRAEMYQGTRRMGQGTMTAGPTSAIPAYRYGPEDQPPSGGSQSNSSWSQQNPGQRDNNPSNRPRWISELESKLASGAESTGQFHGFVS